MAKKSFLEEAVVAAKEVREAAIQHAYKELEENLTPSIKEALAQKLEKDLDIEDLDEGNGAVAGFKPVKVKEPKKEIKEEDDPETDKEDKTSEEDEEVDENPADKNPEEDEDLPEPEDEDKPVTDEEPKTEEEEEISDDTELSDLTVGQLKDLVSTMVAAIAPEKPAEQPDDMEPADVQGKGDEDVPIEAEPESEEDLHISSDEEDSDKDEEDVEIDLQELLDELASEEHKRKVVNHKEDAEFQKELDEVKAERDEALKTIEEMTETLRNTNLLNAKLSSTVKLFSRPLTESQRSRAIKALDEASTVKEVKAIYGTLVESFNSEKKNSIIREHKGSASRVVGKSTAAPIVEVDPVVARFQKLAGIIN